MVTIKGRRDTDKTVHGDDFFHQELYWGSFSRTILLPEEVDPDGAEAMSKHGLLIITLPKLDRSIIREIKNTMKKKKCAKKGEAGDPPYIGPFNCPYNDLITFCWKKSDDVKQCE